MPVTSVYRIGGGSSITTDNSASLAAQSAANGALSSTLSSAGVTLTGAGLGVSTGLNVTGSATVSGLTVQNALNVSGSSTLSGLTVQNALNVTGPTTVSGLTATGFVSLSGAGQAGIASSATGGTTNQVSNALIKAASTVVLYSFKGAPGATQQLTIVDGGFYIISTSAANYNWFIAKY